MSKYSAAEVVDHMMKHDQFSQWLGIEVLDVQDGFSRITMTLREEMLNGFGIIHGGVTFAFSDSAFAFACNNRNQLSVALDTSINFLKPGMPGDVLIAEAREVHNGRKTGLYHITVTNQRNEQIAFFKGTCYRMDKQLIQS